MNNDIKNVAAVTLVEALKSCHSAPIYGAYVNPKNDTEVIATLEYYTEDGITKRKIKISFDQL